MPNTFSKTATSYIEEFYQFRGNPNKWVYENHPYRWHHGAQAKIPKGRYFIDTHENTNPEPDALLDACKNLPAYIHADIRHDKILFIEFDEVAVNGICNIINGVVCTGHTVMFYDCTVSPFGDNCTFGFLGPNKPYNSAGYYAPNFTGCACHPYCYNRLDVQGVAQTFNWASLPGLTGFSHRGVYEALFNQTTTFYGMEDTLYHLDYKTNGYDLKATAVALLLAKGNIKAKTKPDHKLKDICLKSLEIWKNSGGKSEVIYALRVIKREADLLGWLK